MATPPPPPRLTTLAKLVGRHLLESSRLVKSIVSTIRSRRVCSLQDFRSGVHLCEIVVIVLEIRPVQLARLAQTHHYACLYLITLIAPKRSPNKHVQCAYIHADRHPLCWSTSKRFTESYT